jgi:hypothetical protein
LLDRLRPVPPFSPAYYIRGGEFRGKHMSIFTCPECGDRFEKDAPWKKTCMPCWKESKRVEHDELLELRAEVAALRRRLQAVTATTALAIPPDMLARLIRLCHPDKHGNSEASNTATSFLLAQREARS